MARVYWEHAYKSYGRRGEGDGGLALKDFDLEVPDKEFMVLVGPSGCGKSTALRCLAGLEQITEGGIWIGDRLVTHVQPKDRDIAMDCHSYALYPHKPVARNIGFGLKIRHVPKDEIERKVRSAAQILGVEELLQRKPGQLSGGQRQRVALARTIVREPRAFLLDEPLSNLDAKLRVHTRAEISKLHRNLGATFIYVTHDQTEAMTMADRIAVMNLGVIQQVGTPQDLYDRPTNMFVAGFIGSPAMNFFDARVDVEGDKVELDGGTFTVPVPQKVAVWLSKYPGRRLKFGVRPEDLHDKDYPPPDITASPVDVKVDVTELMGNEVFLHLMAGETKLLARVDPRTKVKPGDKVQVVMNMDRLQVFDPESEEALRK
ncbi:MAG: sn-glycerol-3-phosphate ABC transporter ATP-binding protein UgpC [Actinomycetota bacterium]|nr:sn-glycerol-3-phosphate ABC transporter ATP-binding protein UgpC [Actinomycetota bacterium]